jgi:hypothetical protein
MPLQLRVAAGVDPEVLEKQAKISLSTDRDKSETKELLQKEFQLMLKDRLLLRPMFNG